MFPMLTLTSIITFGQNETGKCGIHYYMDELYKNDPDLKKRVEKSFETPIVNKSGVVDTNLMIIPVVFHVLHQYGVENINDTQVYDQMRILNEDYRLRNADTAAVVSAFDTLMADAHIEFRLATIDPWGNPTNGIEHIYSHELNTGDMNSKLNQWDRSKYLNVWTNKQFPANGDGTTLLGYSMFPSSVEGTNFYVDGIIFVHNTIGTIGTGAGNDGRTLTHEAGHWLNLEHTWGPTNSPNVACGDDGVADTPITQGSFVCNLAASECNAPIIENTQNYMEYAACSNMFTKGQVARLRFALKSDVGDRSSLITDSNAIMTGINQVAVCKPKADFYASSRFVCQGGNITFKDVSWRAVATARTWTFEGGTPATSTTATQSVTYDTPGYKKVTLSVENANGVDELVEENYIFVSPGWADFTGPYSNDLETGNAYWFLKQNPENNFARFDLSAGTGYYTGTGANTSTCYKLNNFKDVSGALAYTNDWFYNKRLGNSQDALITPSFDLRYTTGVNISFKYSFASNTNISTDMTEVMKVYTSRDCGETWSLKKTYTGVELVASGGFAGYTDFVPTLPSQWHDASFAYSTGSLDGSTRVKIEFTASDYSNNLYIDNFNITGTLGIDPTEISDLELTVYPNPLSSQQSINVSYIAGENPIQLILRDVQGKIVHSETVNTINAKVDHKLEIGKTLSSSCYFLEVKSGDFSTVKKVVVL